MKGKRFTGAISINSKGVGFFDLDPENKKKTDSIEIQPEYVNRAFHGDIVEIEATGEKIKNRDQGKVVRVVTRTKNEYVGTVVHGDAGTYVVPDDKRMYADIFLPTQEEAKIPEGTKVLAEIDWAASTSRLVGRVVKIIGASGENNTEMEAIVLEKGFRVEFPLTVEAEAELLKQKYPTTFETEIKNRRDMRSTTTMTIDPADAKDFDDAISFVDLGNDTYEIGVHIADVSYFVTPGTELDREAEKRGLSVYLVDRTIPMLPEVLSNDLCSLNPNEDKYTFSAVFKIDNSTVHSKQNFEHSIALQKYLKRKNLKMVQSTSKQMRSSSFLMKKANQYACIENRDLIHINLLRNTCSLPTVLLQSLYSNLKRKIFLKRVRSQCTEYTILPIQNVSKTLQYFSRHLGLICTIKKARLPLETSTNFSRMSRVVATKNLSKQQQSEVWQRPSTQPKTSDTLDLPLHTTHTLHLQFVDTPIFSYTVSSNENSRVAKSNQMNLKNMNESVLNQVKMKNEHLMQNAHLLNTNKLSTCRNMSEKHLMELSRV
jgi:hypothetical protein